MNEQVKTRGRPKAEGMNAQLEQAEKQFDKFDQEIKEMTLDRMNMAPKEDVEGQTKLSSKEIEKTKDIYIKPERSIASREKFNEDYRADYNFAKEYVHFIAEHRELIGETLEFWTKPFSGMPAEFWKIPSGKPIWAPRYVAEQIKKCTYHRLVMQPNMTHTEGFGQFYGSMAADTIIQRLDAIPVNERKSVFMGARSF